MSIQCLETTLCASCLPLLRLILRRDRTETTKTRLSSTQKEFIYALHAFSCLSGPGHSILGSVEKIQLHL